MIDFCFLKYISISVIFLKKSPQIEKNEADIVGYFLSKQPAYSLKEKSKNWENGADRVVYFWSNIGVIKITPILLLWKNDLFLFSEIHYYFGHFFEKKPKTEKMRWI